MAYQDRRYYRDGGGGEDYLGNPAAVVNMSVPFGTWFGVRVRLHFWMLLSLLFAAIYQARFGPPVLVPALLALILISVAIHEIGRRLSTMLIGGRHDEFLLWPAGGIIHPTYRDQPLPMFVSHIGGVVVNLVVAAICAAVLAQAGYDAHWSAIVDPLMALLGFGGAVIGWTWPSVVWCFLLANIGVMWASLLPYYWFDGGHLLQSILWPLAGRRRAIIITCIIGMALAVVMFFMALSRESFLGMVFWGLLFASAYTRWKQARSESEYDHDGDLSWAGGEEGTRWHRMRKRGRLAGWLARRKAAREQKDQAAVDRILEKVAQHGMHSLNNSEKRTLARASERLRNEQRM